MAEPWRRVQRQATAAAAGARSAAAGRQVCRGREPAAAGRGAAAAVDWDREPADSLGTLGARGSCGAPSAGRCRAAARGGRRRFAAIRLLRLAHLPPRPFWRAAAARQLKALLGPTTRPGSRPGRTRSRR
ncbi:unnamed protein product [Prorocentrum cordatum]|uniref:Uncharacterized protein n=1 Tax=Prorocentrum cordatum TaxID=2364126 RepID=A0ABN9PPJ4_9DINO|nr:unnamed protein product [Polarella glacialis]